MKMPENLRQISDIIIPRQKINSESDTTRETLRNIANQKSMIITLITSTRNQQLQIKTFIILAVLHRRVSRVCECVIYALLRPGNLAVQRNVAVMASRRWDWALYDRSRFESQNFPLKRQMHLPLDQLYYKAT